MSVVGSPPTALEETPGRLDPLGSPGEGGVVMEGVCHAGARPGHHLVAGPEHPLGGGATVGGSGGTCP